MATFDKDTDKAALRKLRKHVDKAYEIFLDGKVSLGEFVAVVECAKLRAALDTHEEMRMDALANLLFGESEEGEQVDA